MSIFSKGRKVLLLVSYCDGSNPDCTNDCPCDECLKICNVFELKGHVEVKYVGELRKR